MAARIPFFSFFLLWSRPPFAWSKVLEHGLPCGFWHKRNRLCLWNCGIAEKQHAAAGDRLLCLQLRISALPLRLSFRLENCHES
jgi:hypothetical protein